jgi:hypothetical protein
MISGPAECLFRHPCPARVSVNPPAISVWTPAA